AEFIRPYWPAERALVNAGYRNIPFPFEEVPVPSFEMTAEWDMTRLLGYINTWSALRRYEKEHGKNPLSLLGPILAAAWGDPSTVRTVRWRFSVRLGRVHP